MRYSASARSTCVWNTNAAYVHICTVVPPQTGKSSLLSLQVSGANTPGAPPQWAIFRPIPPSGVPVSTTTFLPEEDAGAPDALTQLVTVWSVASNTGGANSFRRSIGANAVGASFMWAFPRGLGLPAGGTGVALYATTGTVPTGGPYDVLAVIDE